MLKYVLPVAFALRPSMVYGMIKSRLSEIIPLNQLLGIEIASVDDGVAEARLPFKTEITNHIGTMHATAIFGLAEAASGAAMSGAFAPLAASIRPVAANARIDFLKIARTGLVARAKTSRDSKELRDSLKREGKVVFDVVVDVADAFAADIARITVSWHVTAR
ncbi:uncharacterized protein (TIGR00369 family) [Bradyrhizobium japonicum]